MLTLPNSQSQIPSLKTKARKDMTERQRVIFQAIVDFKTANDGNSPSTRELMQASGVTSTSVLRFNLARLQTEGFIQLERGSRMIRVHGGRWTLNS